MLAKAPSLAADEVIVDLEDAVAAEDKEQARGLAVAALRRGPLGRTTALRVNGRSTRVVGGRPPRGCGGASRRGRTPQGRVPRGRVRRGRAAPGRHRHRGPDRDGARTRRGRADRRRRRRARGARLRSGRPRCLARRAGADDRRRRLRLRARARGRGCPRLGPAGARRAARPPRRRPRPRPLRAARARARLRRQVGDPPEPDRARQPDLHPVAGRPGTREAAPRSSDAERPASRESSSTRRRAASPSPCSDAPGCSPSGLPPFHLRREQHRAIPEPNQPEDRCRSQAEDPGDACHRAAEGTSAS